MATEEAPSADNTHILVSALINKLKDFMKDKEIDKSKENCKCHKITIIS